MNFNSFNCHSMKARISWVQKVLGLPVTGKRDKVTVKSLVKFQKDHGLAGNGSVCKETYRLLCELGGSSVDISQ